MNPSEKPNKPVGGIHLEKDYYDEYNSFFDLEMMAARIQEMELPEDIRTNLSKQERLSFLVLGSATTKNINGITKIAHYLHNNKEAVLNDLVTIVDINDTSLTLHKKAIHDLDKVSDWNNTSIRETSVKTFPYPEFKLEKGDIRSLSQQQNSVDVAISDYTINYLASEEDVGKFFQEVSRVLKENGIFYIAFRYSKDDSPTEIINQGGVEICLFKLSTYEQLADDAGLKIISTEGKTMGSNNGDILILLEKKSSNV